MAFKSPKSYTTEDIIEIQCHGGINVTQKILQICLNNGARLAEKGEFTKRAFLEGRIDLTQVEAVLDIISAKTEVFSSAAAYNLSGQLSEFINQIRILLTNLLAHIEASVDFPEEVDEMPYIELISHLNKILKIIQEILNKASDGNILKHGIKIAIVGKPNVGKSSIFNTLLKTERAIVTNIPGTTRDILQETIDIDGIPVVLTDTAGIRKTENKNDNDFIESIGVDRSIETIQTSDLILFVYDITSGILKEDSHILQESKKYNKPIIIMANKADISKNITSLKEKEILISAKTGTGIKELTSEIKKTILGENFKVQKDEVYINLRHKECLQKSLNHIKLAIEAANKEEMQDLISIDIKSALLSLDELVGEVVAENIIDRIFSQFCIGK